MRAREITAMLVAPLVSGALQALVMRNPVALLFALPFAYLFALLVGGPALFVVRKKGWNGLTPHLLAGSAAGLCAGLLLTCFISVSGFQASAVAAGLLFFALHGAVVAGAYWTIARWN